MPTSEELQTWPGMGFGRLPCTGSCLVSRAWTAVFYLLEALWLFRGKSLKEVREIVFEIGMLGQHGRDESETRETHVLRAALRGRISWRWGCCASRTPGLQRIEPGMEKAETI